MDLYTVYMYINRKQNIYSGKYVYLIYSIVPTVEINFLTNIYVKKSKIKFDYHIY